MSSAVAPKHADSTPPSPASSATVPALFARSGRRKKTLPLQAKRLTASVTLNMATGPTPGDISVFVRKGPHSDSGSPSHMWPAVAQGDNGLKSPATAAPTAPRNRASPQPNTLTSAASDDDPTAAPSLETSGESSTDGDIATVPAAAVAVGALPSATKRRRLATAPTGTQQCQPGDSPRHGFTRADSASLTPSDSSSRPSSVTTTTSEPMRLLFIDGVSVLAGDGTTLTECQSCHERVDRSAEVVVNPHHHVNPFYSQLATYAMSRSANNNASFLIPPPHGSQFPGSARPSNVYTTAGTVPTAEPTSMKPTTLTIPVEKTVLCIPCLVNFRKHRLICDECDFVPAMSERSVTHCSRCFEGVVSRH